MARNEVDVSDPSQKRPRKRPGIGWRTSLAIGLPTIIFVGLGLQSGIVAGSFNVPPQPDITVSSNGRYFVDPAGDPFFWMADTAWSMPVDLTREEVAGYLNKRADQGFTVVQTVAIFNQAGGPGPNRYGDYPYDGDLSDLAVSDEGAEPGDPWQYDYWDHLDYIVAEANTRGLRVALLPIWANKQAGTVLTKDNAVEYGKFVGARYRDNQVIWVMGGDAAADGVEDVWRALARGIAIGVTGEENYNTALMTYHPIGGSSSTRWFVGDPWLKFDMVQGGHCLRYDERRGLLDAAYNTTPTRPFLDGEPIYAAHPYCWDRPPEGYSTALDVRRDAYWAVFAGAAGHTYGHHSVWQFLGSGGPAELGAVGDWQSALNEEAAWQMRHLVALMTSHPWWMGIPDQNIITTPIGTASSRPQAIRATDRSYVMVYSPDGGAFDADLSSVFAGATANLSWFDPQTGKATDLGIAPAGPATYTPPTARDWVLVADAVPDSPPSPPGTEPAAPCATTPC
jgi:hypothetical protein